MQDGRTQSVKGAELARMIGQAASLAVALVPTAPALAGEPCARVRAPSDLSPSWALAVDDLRRQIALLPSSDCQPMTLAIESSPGGGIRVVAMASDGRLAEREVRREENLVATALGLIIAIPWQAAPPPSAVPSTPTPHPPPPGSPAPSDLPAGHPSDPPQSSPKSSPKSREIALFTGLSAGLRLLAPSSAAVVDVEARADLLIDRWMLVASIRSALVSCLGVQGFDCDLYNDASFGVGVGRRIPAGSASVDVALEPSVVAMHMEYDRVPDLEGSSVQGTEVALRIDASARLAAPVGQNWIITLTMDAGLAPALLAAPVHLDAPGAATASVPGAPLFPPFAGGLRIGASGALL
jgi:hypothetical protein